MFTSEDNDVLSHVGPGTPMGALFRRYWLPALLSRELEANGAPVRVRLVGEDLIAFRDSEGRVGLLAENCPHRGASLYFAKNDDCGLRCWYHGWKFDIEGKCLDMPNEPPQTQFKDRIRQLAYPCIERNGVVLTYMGPADKKPGLPESRMAARARESGLCLEAAPAMSLVAGLGRRYRFGACRLPPWRRDDPPRDRA